MTFKRKLHFWGVILLAVFVWIFVGSLISNGLHPLIAMPIIMMFLTPFIVGIIAFLIWIYKEEQKYYANIKCN